jgi:arylsulfatase A-like enzyme
VRAPDPGRPPPETISLAEQFPGHSALFLGKWHVGSSAVWQETPQAHGWDLWRAGVPFYVAGNPQTTCGGYDYRNWVSVEDGVAELVFDGYQPGLMVRRFEEWWPFEPSPRFCVFASQLAHDPYHRPPSAWLPPSYPPTPTDRKKYEAMIAAADLQLGELLAHVDLARTLVVVVGDNGTPREVAPDPTHAKTTTFERGIHVPLLFAGAGIPPGNSHAMVHMVDVHATIAALAGGQSHGDGVSLVPILAGRATRARHFLLSGIRGDPQFADDVCVRSQRYKLRRSAQGEEFYDLCLDPEEQVNRIEDPLLAPKITTHRAWLDAHLP